MLKALYQLNSEPVVLLKKIEKCVKNKLPDCTANIDRDAMQRYQIVKKSPDPRDHSSSSLNLKINLTGGVPTCLKRKASLEDAFTEADAVYETHKKLKKDESVDSDSSKKRSKHHQGEKPEFDKKTKGSETSDKEKGKTKKKLEKEKFKSLKSEPSSETSVAAKSGHHTETGGSGLSSSELQTKHTQKKDRKHERKKKKSKEKSKDGSKCPLDISTPESKKQSDNGEDVDGSEETVAIDKGGEVSVSIPKPASADEDITDEEVFEAPKEVIDALVEDEQNCDLPRSDSAATVALDMDMDRRSVNSATDDVEPEFVNLASPDKTNTPADDTFPLNDATENEMDVTLERLPEIGSSHKVCEEELPEETKETEDGVDDAQSSSVVDSSLTETANVTALITSKSETESLQNSEADGSTLMEVEKPENDLIDRVEDQIVPREGLEESAICTSPAASEQGVEVVPQTAIPSSPVSANLETEPEVILPIIVDKDNENSSDENFSPVKKMCCMPIDVPIEQLDQQESQIGLEKIEIESALSAIIAERKTLGKELRLLLLKSKELEEELTVKNTAISADVILVQTLSDAVNVAREERNRLAADKKRTHHMVLQTEIKLRELQVLLIRQQLDLGDTKLVESHPLFNDMSDNEKLVADLTEQVANKSATHKETEAIHQKAEQVFRQKNEEHETLVKRLEEARKMCQELNEYLSKVTSEIGTIKSKLSELADDGKRKCLRAVDIEEESIKIEYCKKLKEIEVKRQNIAVIDDNMEFEYLIPKLCQLLPIKIQEEKKEETASKTATLLQPENSALNNPSSPDSRQSPHQFPFAQQLPTTVPPVTVAESLSNLLIEDTGSTYHIIETVAVSSEVQSPVVMDTDFSPQTQPMCLRIPSTSVAGVSPTLSNVTTTTLGSPSIIQSTPSSNPIALRVENLTNPEPTQASTSQNITPASFALSPHPISLKSLSEAYPFYAQFINPNSPTANSDDEAILYQEIVNGCRNFTHWKCSYSCSKDFSNIARDNPLLRQSAGLMKDYLIPFYRLMLKKNTTAALLFDSIIHQAQKANWYGMAAVDSTYMKQMLENNLRSAIDIGTKYKDQSAILPSRVEFSPSSGKSSMPTFTIHLATPEAFRSPTLANQMQTSNQNSVERSSADRTPVNTVTQGDHSPIGALNTMITNQNRQVNQQTPGPTQHSPNTVAVEGHPGMPRQGWTGNSVNNGMVAYQSNVVQNTAVVVPIINAQYTGRHRMPAVQQTVPPPHSTWPQQTAQQTAHQAYVQNLQSNRMQVPVNYQAGPYRQQQQATLQHQYMHPNGSQQSLGSSQQLHNRLAGPIAGDSPSRQQNMSILGSHLQQAQAPVQQQRIRQQSSSQQLTNQPTVSHHLSGMQQQQVPHSQAHSLQNAQHQIMQQQRHMPMSSPPINAQAQRNFPGQQSDIARQPAIRRLSRDVPQPQQHPLYTCLKCGQEAQQKCSGCQTTFYCSRDCQVAHWDEHGKTCSKQNFFDAFKRPSSGSV
ncbi:hypothetical protein DAPPUDRAFT_222245 [Daphnia pulex]|uniref:MYND-type domain-containing protein n=1 Tax=Daphnia pulex TaxID=6669 RepID=E9G2G1_DAPPU|nr:hypothetical protein DAPPUDRAFT_222245 [Daphnia pulex]|eukprot:EFX86243.1 hypothetical protein DAPPUDRAFT_222245 [Daphnia pulex]